MSFDTSVSGLKAASIALGIIGNNIANAGTTGFKTSRGEFADVFTTSLLGSSSDTAGKGVSVVGINQSFSQGNITFTDNVFDMAINGSGFFVLNDGGTKVYSRAGNFQVDREGFVVNPSGNKLMVFKTTPEGVSTGEMGELHIDTSLIQPKATGKIELLANLDSRANQPLVPWPSTGFNAFADTAVTVPSNSAASGAFAPHTGTDTGETYTLSIGGTQIFSYTEALGTDLSAADIQAAIDDFVADSDGAWTIASGSVAGGDLVLSRADGQSFTISEGGELAGTVGFDGSFLGTHAGSVALKAPDPKMFNASTSSTIFDSLGNSHVQSFYFVKTATENQWDVHVLIDGVSVGGPTTVTFEDTGQLSADSLPLEINISGWQPLDSNGAVSGASPQNITIDLSSITQFGNEFSVNNLSQDGYTTGQLRGVEVGDRGIMYARYTNGQARALGQIALANFSNLAGLQPLGSTTWAETYASGQPAISSPGSAGLGTVQSGALEDSNVEVTQQLVDMIVAQRNFQANAKVIQTEDAITQTVINMR